MGHLEGKWTQQSQRTTGAEGEKVIPMAVEGSQECSPINPTWALLGTCLTKRQQHGLWRHQPNTSFPAPICALSTLSRRWRSQKQPGKVKRRRTEQWGWKRIQPTLIHLPLLKSQLGGQSFPFSVKFGF